jgi:hypothetical protein
VVAHQLVQVHRLQNGRVEAGEEFGGDRQDRNRVLGIPKAVLQGLLGVPVTLEGPVTRLVFLLAVQGDDDVGLDVLRQQAVQLGLVALCANVGETAPPG